MTQFRHTDYDHIAGSYDEHRKHWQHWQSDPDDVIQLRLDVDGRVDVLDVGCGTGFFLAGQRSHFADRPVRLIGLDHSASMLGVASSKGVAVLRARAEEIPFRDGSFDYVYASFAFHHFHDKDSALDEITRALRRGGTFRIRDMDPWSLRSWWVYRFFDGTWETDLVRFWPVSRLSSELERRGFSVSEYVERSSRTRTAADVLDEAERRTISQLAILDDDIFEAGIERLRALDPEEPIAADRARLTLTAQKP